MNGYVLLAEFVLVLHLGFVLFVVLGGLLVLRWPRLAFLHLPALAWGIFIELSGGVCPLTPLENALRRSAGQAGYDGGFIEYYLAPLLYPSVLTPATQAGLATALMIVNFLVYMAAWKRRQGSR